jgi:transposase
VEGPGDTGLAARIRETAGALHARERATPDKVHADRLHFLRLLKDGRATPLAEAAALLAYHVRNAERWWKRHRGGLAAPVAPPKRRSARERITPEAWAGLESEMRAGHVGGLPEAQAYLRLEWNVEYGIDAVSKLFKRRKTKLKTG